MAESIREFGWGAPALARRASREVIAGHTRLLAAEHLRRRWAAESEARRQEWHAEAVRVATAGDVLVRFLDLEELAAHKLAIADNRTGEDTTWNKSELASLLGELEESGEGLAATGFDSDELERLLGRGYESVVEELDVTSLSARFWITVEGPLPAQADALDKLRAALASIEGLEVDIRVL